MQAYKYSDLYHKMILEQASEAFLAGCLHENRYKQLLATSSSHLFRPNYLFRIGMGLLTAIAYVFLLALLAYSLKLDNEAGFRAVIIVMTIAAYCLLEFLIKEQHYYNAGVDNVLMLLIGGSVMGLLWSAFSLPAGAIVFGTMLICAWLCIRFTDALMGALALVLAIMWVCIELQKMGMPVAVVPFIACFFCAVVYVLMKRLEKKETFLLYAFTCRVVRLVALTGGYLCVNVAFIERYIIWANEPLAFPGVVRILFWVTTMLGPVVMLLYGLKKKELVVLRIAACLLVIALFTFHMYFSVMRAEQLSVTGGGILILGIYLLIKWLAVPRGGFVFKKEDNTENKLLKDAQAAIVAQVFGKNQSHLATTASSATILGGGSSGGGGASGNY